MATSSVAGSFVPAKSGGEVSRDKGESAVQDAPIGASASMDSGTRMRSVAGPKRRLGKAIAGFDKRKWGDFDMARGIQANVPVVITRDDRMSPEEAKDKLLAIFRMYGMERANEGEQLAFARGVWLHLAINSASVLQPGRAKMVIAGSDFDLADIVRKLGVDLRRFSRAFADEIRVELRRQLDNYDPDDPVSEDVNSWIRGIAVDRGLQRFPDLIHDSAAACTKLSMAEIAAINHSTNLVLSSGVNAVDSMRARAAPLTADQYDSTNGERVVGAIVEHRGRN